MVERFSAVQGLTLESQCAEPIGAQFITGADDVYVVPLHVARRSRVEQQYIRMFGTGEDVRDWQVSSSAALIFPYDASFETLPHLTTDLNQWFAPFKGHLENVIISGSIRKKDTNLRWFEYRRLAKAKLRFDFDVIVPQIAMYNHACFSDHSVAFKEKAQAIAFKDFVSPIAIYALILGNIEPKRTCRSAI